MSDRIRAVIGCGSEGCDQYVVRGEEFGRVVDRVAIVDAEVWQVEWPDGSIYLLSTDELEGVQMDRPPNRPPDTKTGT